MKKEENVTIKLQERRKIQEKGITLVALVVTIIILLILAGVTLNLALGEGGIFARAKNTVDRYQAIQANELGQLTELERELDKYGETGNPNIPPEEDRDLVSTVTDTEHEDNKKVKDSLGNPLVIPSGFKYKGGINVEDGIVIEDKDGNQFVWIPVSNINGNNDETGTGLIETTNKGKVEITLGRYTFKDEYNGTQELASGTPELIQRGSERDSDDDIYNIKWKKSASVVYGDFKESTNLDRQNGGRGTEKLDDFITSVESNHGYYIARYEAGTGSNGKPVSKQGPVWNNITQSDALDAAQGMYVANENFVSDLVNSYAWDTAIVFIEKMGNENYAIAGVDTTGNKVLKNTGTTNDVKCNIYDMSANLREWSTEYCTYTDGNVKYACVGRGTYYNSGAIGRTAHRNCTPDTKRQRRRFSINFVYRKVTLNAGKT